MTRALLFVAIACSHPKPAPPPPPPPPAVTCAKVADHIVSLMSGAQNMPPEASDPFRRIVEQRCDQDRWSTDAKSCLLNITTLEEGEKCQQLMTEAQVDAFHRDTQAALSDLHQHIEK